MKIKIFIFLGLLFMVACQSKSKPAIDPETYKNILKEIILVDLVQKNLETKDTLHSNLITLVYKKYHVDSLQLKKNTSYYTEHPDELEQIYQQIYTELKQEADSLSKLKSFLNSSTKTESKVIKVSKKTVQKGLHINN